MHNIFYFWSNQIAIQIDSVKLKIKSFSLLSTKNIIKCDVLY